MGSRHTCSLTPRPSSLGRRPVNESSSFPRPCWFAVKSHVEELYGQGVVCGQAAHAGFVRYATGFRPGIAGPFSRSRFGQRNQSGKRTQRGPNSQAHAKNRILRQRRNLDFARCVSGRRKHCLRLGGPPLHHGDSRWCRQSDHFGTFLRRPAEIFAGR